MTNLRKINKKTGKRRILIAPLDWGLGHATRCIPIIKLLIEQGIEPIIAGGKKTIALMEMEFPNLVILPLKGYDVKYSDNQDFFFLKMLSQAPKLIAAISYENKWLNYIIDEYEIDAVISDNRFGLHTNKVPCILITHQLSIQAGNKPLNRLAQKINYRYINKFSECWIPDIASKDNLAGELSHPKQLPAIPVKYIGILTRCRKLGLSKDIDLLMLISGPEPQRSIFENILLDELKEYNERAILLRGLPGEENELVIDNENVTILNHLPAKELNEIMEKSKRVIARSGYSTIMDLVALNQQAILIPTPGQSEQEYLAEYLGKKNMFYTCSQENFHLEKELENSKQFQFSGIHVPGTINKAPIIDWLNPI